jgi:hypothetical protein
MIRIATKVLSACLLLAFSLQTYARLQSGEVHVWEVQEITLATARHYDNP